MTSVVSGFAGTLAGVPCLFDTSMNSLRKFLLVLGKARPLSGRCTLLYRLRNIKIAVARAVASARGK